ncbi:MAG: DUF3127 domain-containing protein [Candidatus Bostrichicola ureolyticus]|nr:MAG: DUF3127 domain-containing protein [Candidatus Bostrichicola ureolyticus]
MEIIGTIKKIFDVKTFNNGFKKRELIIKTEEQYPQNILIEFIQEKINLLNMFKYGDKVKIYINIKGREWNNPEGITKYFNSIQGWKIEKFNFTEKEISNFKNKNEFDDLPF